MININRLNYKENRFYKSALAFCEGVLFKNDGDLEDSINETLNIFNPYVTSIDKLKEYLIQQIL